MTTTPDPRDAELGQLHLELAAMRARLAQLEWERQHTTQYWYSGGVYGPDILVEGPCEEDPKWTVTEENAKHSFDTRDEALAKLHELINAED